MYMCTIYTHLFVCPSIHACLLCVYTIVCILCVYTLCVLSIFAMHATYIYIPSKFVHLFIHLSISPSLHLLVYVWFFCILSIYTVYVSRCYTVYLCCICVSFMMMIKIMKNCFCKMVDQ